MVADAARALVSETPQLGALPQAYHQLTRVLQDKSGNAQRIANAVQIDPALTARLLGVVNSAALAGGRSVDTVSHAAMLVGSAQLQQLALATAVVQMFQRMPEHLLDMRSFWKHSVAVALGTHLLARATGARRTEAAFVAGLLHDVGGLLVCLARPTAARDVLLATEGCGRPHHEVERERLGCDHAEIGAVLLEVWELPPATIDVVRWHHDPSAAPAASQRQVDLVHVADVAVSALQIGNAGERAAHPLDLGAWDRLGVSPAQLDEVLLELQEQVTQVTEALLRP